MKHDYIDTCVKLIKSSDLDAKWETIKNIESQLIAVFLPLIFSTDLTGCTIEIKALPSNNAETIGEITQGVNIKAYDIVDNDLKSF